MAPSAIQPPPALDARREVTKLTKEPLPAGLVRIPPSKLDLRSDDEIAALLQTRRPIVSDKNVWAFWHTGFQAMQPWNRRNIINWTRRLGPEWTVHVVDRVDGSPTNIFNYVDKSPQWFPRAFLENTMDGPSVGPHSGDLVRLPLLWLYGGVWMDAGTLLFRHIEDICWREIEDPASPYEMAGFIIEMRPEIDTMLNGFIATKRHNDFVRKWHEIYLELWRGENQEGGGGHKTNAAGFHKHPLLAHLPLLKPPVDKLNCPDLNVMTEAFNDYLAHFLCFERLRTLVDDGKDASGQDKFDGPEYYAKKMWFAPAMQELWAFQQQTGWSGTRQFELLNTHRDNKAQEKDDLWTQAESFVHEALANTATMKLSHGPAGALDSFLADLWDSEEHQDKDIAEGTFAAYLRYGSVHYDQIRVIEPVKPRTAGEYTLHAGYLEPKTM
ncbi:glycosyltransferase [Microdochium trichocladiopsis]|uniref:Glycosyltransferase n=1 Tax=Microdochium trichocladiopsis TaxID=1682393 RepID=A0A9P8YKW7_9PEZI|nr:glycosyltransferase [Microdochium trichocladiopsis]KAH7040884.1 glycosyltransferase [Microdochium trichocladiopsis]